MADDELKALLREVISGGGSRGLPPESDRAIASARKERDSDPILSALAKDPKSHIQQDRMDAAVHDLRRAWGLDK